MMPAPIQIAARGLTLGPWWRDRIMRRAEKLAEFHDRITHCRIVVEVPHKHRHKGRLYNVRVDIEVPRGVVVVDREPAPTLSEALDRAFDAAERRLEDQARLIRRSIKHHETHPEAAIVEIYPDAGYGFLETPDGRRIYFHENSVIGDGFPI